MLCLLFVLATRTIRSENELLSCRQSRHSFPRFLQAHLPQWGGDAGLRNTIIFSFNAWVDLLPPLNARKSSGKVVLERSEVGKSCLRLYATSAEYWVLELAGGRDVQRDRLSEFRATGTGVELAARYERWLTAHPPGSAVRTEPPSPTS